jgi:hypothetical protein
LLSTPRTLVDLHLRNNDRSAGLWDLYAPHRKRLTDLILGTPVPERDGRLAVLGAGNANDLELAALAARFSEIHLADLDGVALSRAVRRPDVPTRARLKTHAGRDLSGLLELLGLWRDEPPVLDQLARVAPLAGARVAAQLPGPFDLVVSDCMLSQLAWTCYRALGDGALLTDVLDVAMAAHLRGLVALTRPGGRCLLVTDVASADGDAPAVRPDLDAEALLAELDAEALLAALVDRRALFSGTSPAVARFMLAQDPALARHVDDVRLLPPWRWRISRERTVLVYALAFSRRP